MGTAIFGPVGTGRCRDGGDADDVFRRNCHQTKNETEPMNMTIETQKLIRCPRKWFDGSMRRVYS